MPARPAGRAAGDRAAAPPGWRRLGLWALAAAGLTSAACGEKIEPLPDCGFDIGAPTVSYADTSQGRSIQQMMASSCTGCHNSTGKGRLGAPLDINLDSYGAVVNHAHQTLASMANASMPPQGEAISKEDLCRFDTWMRQKYPQ